MKNDENKSNETQGVNSFICSVAFLIFVTLGEPDIIDGIVHLLRSFDHDSPL
jgi:hypothetical protein